MSAGVTLFALIVFVWYCVYGSVRVFARVRGCVARVARGRRRHFTRAATKQLAAGMRSVWSVAFAMQARRADRIAVLRTLRAWAPMAAALIQRDAAAAAEDARSGGPCRRAARGAAAKRDLCKRSGGAPTLVDAAAGVPAADQAPMSAATAAAAAGASPAETTVVPAAEAVAAAAPGLAPGWSEHFSEEDGAHFYTHDATGESSWTKPDPPAPAAPIPALAPPLASGWSLVTGGVCTAAHGGRVNGVAGSGGHFRAHMRRGCRRRIGVLPRGGQRANAVGSPGSATGGSCRRWSSRASVHGPIGRACERARANDACPGSIPWPHQ